MLLDFRKDFRRETGRGDAPEEAETTTRARPTARELGVATLLLAGLAAATYGSHVADGGFYWDDWKNAASTRFSPDGFEGPLDVRLLAFRPLLALSLPLPHVAFGAAPSLHLALALVLAIATSACFYLVLRTLGMASVHAGVISALVLLFPWSDSTRLWATGSVNHLAIALYLLGLVAALHGLDSDGRRRSLLRVAAVTLYLLSVLTYEIAAIAALLSVLLYAHRVGWRRSVRWWRLEAVAIVCATALVALTTTRDKLSPGEQVDHALAIGDQALSLLARAVVPFGTPSRGVVAGAALLVVAAALAVVVARPRAATTDLRRWLLVACAAVVGIAAGYAMFVPGDAGYLPLAPGTGNRVNVLAALGFVTLLYSLAMLLGTLAFARSPAREQLSGAVAVLLSAVVGVGYLARVETDKEHWAEAAAIQDRVLAQIERSLPKPAAGSTVYTHGHERFAAASVPAFAVSWDLDGAIKLAFDDPSLHGYPVAGGTRIVCEPESMYPAGRVYSLTERASYEDTFVLDVDRGRIDRIESQVECLAASGARERRLGR
jgi:hypothetical protein